MPSIEAGGSEFVGPNYSEELANLPRRVLADFSDNAFKLACRAGSTLPGDEGYRAVEQSVMAQHPPLRLAARDIQHSYTKPLYAYDEPQEELISQINRSTTAGTSTVAYNLLISPRIRKIIRSTGESAIANYVPSALAIAKDQDRSLQVGEEIKFKCPEIGKIFDFVLAKANKSYEVAKIFANNPDVDLELNAPFFKESAHGLLIAFAASVGLANIKPLGSKLEDLAYMDKPLISYEQAVMPYRRPDFDIREHFEEAPAFLNIYNLIIEDLDSFIDEVYEYAEMPHLRNSYREACFAGLQMLYYDGRLRPAINSTDLSALQRKAKEACSSGFFMVTEMDGGEGIKRLVRDLPLTANLLNNIGHGKIREFVNTPFGYVSDGDLDFSGEDLTLEEFEAVGHIPDVTPLDLMDRAGLILAETIFSYVRLKEAHLILNSQQ